MKNLQEGIQTRTGHEKRKKEGGAVVERRHIESGGGTVPGKRARNIERGNPLRKLLNKWDEAGFGACRWRAAPLGIAKGWALVGGLYGPKPVRRKK